MRVDKLLLFAAQKNQLVPKRVSRDVRTRRRISRAVAPLGTGKSSNCRSEGVRAAVRSLVSNKAPWVNWLSLVSAQETSVRRG